MGNEKGSEERESHRTKEGSVASWKERCAVLLDWDHVNALRQGNVWVRIGEEDWQR